MISATITGRIGADPEIKFVGDNKTPVLKLSIASNSAKGKDEPSTWVRASLFGDRGEKLKDYLHKGDRVAACGTIELRKWKGNDGKEMVDLEMRVDQIDLIQDRKDDDRDERGRDDRRESRGNDRGNDRRDDDRGRRDERGRDDRREQPRGSSSGGERRARF